MSPRSRHIFSGLIISLVLLAGFLGWSNLAAAQNKLGDLGLSQIQPELGLGTTDIRVMVARIIRVALTFLGVVALGLMLYGGYLWMTAGGNEEQINSAKKVLINAAIGLAIILSSYAIVSFVINKLVEATTVREGEGQGGGGGNPYFPKSAFYVDQMPAGGNVCIRNVHPIIVFNRGVALDQGLKDNIVIEKVAAPGQPVAGSWQYGDQHNIINFVPKGDCGGGPDDCLEASTTYKLSFKDTSKVKAENNPDLVLNCNIKANCKNPVQFTTGNGVDRLPPTITIDAPDPNTPLQIGQPVSVKVHYKDDNGVQNISLWADNYFVGSQSIAGCVKEDIIPITWPTIGLSSGQHVLDALGYDWAMLKGQAKLTVTLRPPYCFNGQKDEDETGVDCGGSCGACGGATCNKNEDCSSGYCEIPQGKTVGVCVDRMRITNVSPLSGAPGTYVTISGMYFGGSTGKIYFASTTNPGNKDWQEAQLVPLCGKGFSNWTPWQILAEAPGLNAGLQGPIMVITASTTGNDGVVRKFTDTTKDGFGPKIPDYQFTNQNRPGLCGAVPDSQSPGGLISLLGKNFGPWSAQNKVLFGETNGSVSQFTRNNNPDNWATSLIQEVGVPFLEAGVVGLKLIDSQGVESNGIRFLINPGVSADTPLITSVTPNRGARGEYITITGKNFGPCCGSVLFDDQQGGLPIPGSQSFPPACGNSFWRDDQIIVKFDRERGVFNTPYRVRVQAANGKISPPDNTHSFTLEAGSPRPGICKLDPPSAPVPMSPGQYLKIIGENFGNTPNVYFWKTGASVNSITGRLKDTGNSTSSVPGATMVTTTPPSGTATGPVIVYRPGDQKMSNPFSFTVNDCTAQDTCSLLGAEYHCCVSGVERGQCKAELCAGETRATSYLWRFSTQDIANLPRVVERCDVQTEAGRNLPTPSPSVLWDAGQPNPDDGDHHKVCRQAVVIVEFNTALNQTTVKESTVQVFKCKGGVDGNECKNPEVIALSKPGSFALKVAQGNGGGSRQYLEIKRDQAVNWEDSAWYQVVLVGGANGIKTPGNTPFSLAADRPCSIKDSAYCFVFKTDTQDCTLKKLIVTPYTYWTSALEEPIKYRVLGIENGDLYYRGQGLTTQRCIMMGLSGFDWQWSAQDTDYADIFGASTTPEARASALANTVLVGLKNPLDAVNIHAVAATNSKSYPGDSPLTIDLTKPAVTEYWPNCLEACTNADIGAKFNVSMSAFNVNWNSIKLERCLDENCLAVNASSTGNPSWWDGARRILTIPHDELAPKALYKVTLSSADKPALQLWSAGTLKDPAKKSAPMAAEFTWRFRTKKDRCKIGRVDVDPAEYFARSLTDQSIYAVQPFSAPDACNAFGQRLDPWSVSWNWQSSDKNVATVFATSSIGQSPYCTANCLKKGSDLPITVGAIYPVCGNNKVEAGEDCDPSDGTRRCSLNCLFLGNPDSKTCGNGQTEPPLGEACDPKDSKTFIGCSKDCRHTGSTLESEAKDVNASICGNGLIGSGEDCDLGIPGDLKVSTSSIGCSEKCLHLGTRLSREWCEQNKAKFGNFPEALYKTACELGYSQCGDGVTNLDEDVGCDLGNNKKAAWCDEFCRVTDVAHKKCTPNTEGCNANGQPIGSSLAYSKPSVCGDASPGIGEDPACETNLVPTHQGLIDPWALATGVGKGTGSGNPPAQRSNISAATSQNTTGGAINGIGKFTILCGYKTDAECQAVNPAYGVGSDSCCYLRPKLLGVYPGATSTIVNDICPNTYIEAVFDSPIDPSTLGKNVLIARGYNTNPNAKPEARHAGYINNQSDPMTKLNGANRVVVSGKIAYVLATNAQAFQIIDISNSSSPIGVGRLYNGNEGAKLGQPVDMAVAGKYSYVVDFFNNALQVIDISNSTTPHNAGTLNDGDQGAKLKRPSAIDVDGSYAYIVSSDNDGLQIVKLFDANGKIALAPTAFMADGFKRGGFEAHLKASGALADIDVEGNYAYAISNYGTFQIIDIFDPTDPIPLGSLVDGINGVKLKNPQRLFIARDYAYVTVEKGLRIIDIQDKKNPVIVGSANQNGPVRLFNPQGVVVAGRYAYVADGFGGNALEILDVAIPTAPTHTAYLSSDNDKTGEAKLSVPYDVAVQGDMAYVASYSSSALELIDISDFNQQFGVCPEDVTSLLASANQTGSGPWYRRVFIAIVQFIKNIFGGEAAATIYPKPKQWCAGLDVGAAQVLNVSSTQSRVFIRLSQPLLAEANYGIILKDGIRSARGVSIGTSTDSNYKFINWKFNTRGQLCLVDSVTIQPASWLFSEAGATTTLEASVGTAGGQKIQPVNGYRWEFFWEPLNSAFVSLLNTTSSLNIATAQNRNGEVDARATAEVLPNIYGPSGPVAFGSSHLTVYLCSNPWPSKAAYYKNQGPIQVWPYEDRTGNNDEFDLALGQFTGGAMAPTTIVKDGYFNFRTYYCADQGAPGGGDDLPQLRPIVQTATLALEVNKGTCEFTGNECDSTPDCETKYISPNFSLAVKGNSLCAGVTSTAPTTRYFLDTNQVGLVCGNDNDCAADDAFKAWQKKGNLTAKCLSAPGEAIQLQCFRHSPLKRFLFTNEKNGDVVGVQIFANPNNLSASDWYATDKKIGGQGFEGDLRTLEVSGYPAAGDNNNIYVEALNYSTSTKRGLLFGNLYSTIYLFSINSGATGETRAIFDQLLKNLDFNINLNNYQFCGPDTDHPDFAISCRNDLDCPNSQVCSASVDKLKRNLLRFRELKEIDTALESAAKRNGRYPDLKDGSFLKGQTLSVWPSWSLLEQAAGRGLPKDPIKLLGIAGTCGTTTPMFEYFCTGDDPKTSIVCPKDGNNNIIPCVLHDRETGWSAADRRFSFACATSSFAYRYLATSTSYILKSHFEDPGIPVSNWADFIAAFNYSSSSRFGLDNVNGGLPANICLQDNEIASLAGSKCGDKQINWDKGEQCDPPGQNRYGACGGAQANKIKVDYCTNTCQWAPSSTPFIACGDLAVCGNSKVEGNEACDDGKLNGTYNHCDIGCQSFGKAGFCGNDKIEIKKNGYNKDYELCEYSAAFAGKKGWCTRNPFGMLICDSGNDCNNFGDLTSWAAKCYDYTKTKVWYGWLDKEHSCNFDCQSRGPYCGDGIVQAEFGEECDGNQTCQIGGQSGFKNCSASCRFVDPDVAGWWRLDDYVYNKKTAQALYEDSAPIDKVYAECVGADCPDGSFSPEPHNGMTFNGKNKFLKIPHRDKLMPASTLSIEAWIKPSDYGTWPRVLEKGGEGIGSGYGLEIDHYIGHARLVLWKKDGDGNNFSTVVEAKTPVPLDQWAHIVATFERSNNNNTLKMYINGELDNTLVEGSAPAPMVANQEPLTIGKAGDPQNSYYFKGLIGEVKIYSRVLAAVEVKNHFDNAPSVCQAKIPSQLALAPEGECGDGKIDAKEACDQGKDKNGLACTPTYNQSCAYCAEKCDRVITVEAKEYCGNGIIEAKEQCDTDPDKPADIYVKNYLAKGQVDGIEVKLNLGTTLIPFPEHKGYRLRLCPQIIPDQYTANKGLRACVNTCQKLTDCVVCGTVLNGVAVNGGIINVVDPASANPLWSGNDQSKLDLFVNATWDWNRMVAHLYSAGGLSTYHLRPGWVNGDTANVVAVENALLNPDQLCSTGDPRYRLRINDDDSGNGKHYLDFPVSADLQNKQPWKYDLVLSPIISNDRLIDDDGSTIAGSENRSLDPHVRVVVSWVGKDSFVGGFVVPREVQPMVEGVIGNESTKVNYYKGWRKNGIWYHGVGSTVNGTNMTAFTVDTETNNNPLAFAWWPDAEQYAFYVRTPSLTRGIKSFAEARLKVEVYIPEDDTVYRHFARPARTLYLDQAASSGNDRAQYWHVFNIRRWDLVKDPWGVENRLVWVVNPIDGDNGRILTETKKIFN